MKLILTEKPNVTKQIKEVLAPDAHYIRCGGKQGEILGYYENSEFVICNTVGHCVNIMEPKDIDPSFTWDLNKLPYCFPNELPLEISKDKKELFNVIQTCFSKYAYEEIIIATDGDREGQNIWRKIRLMLKPYKAKNINRIWLDEWTPEGIKEAYNNRFPNELKNTLEDAAQCREEADYIIGMNCSVALTKKYTQGKGNVASIGRVMGPTMYIVYAREKEIRNFVPKPYTSLAIETATEESEGLVMMMKGLNKLSREDADEIKNELNNISEVKLRKETSLSFHRCPELYDATSIAKDMNKRYGFSAKKTADIIQRLYQDYALTTYPGTNARKISEGSARKVYKILNNLQSHKKFVEEIKRNNWKVATHLVTSEGLAHEAITPVYGTVDNAKLMKLNKDEKVVYDAIVERFLAAFFPKSEFEEVIISTTAADKEFEATGRSMLNPGWMKVLGVPADTLLPKIIDGKTYSLNKVITENKKTVPPSRYTEETLLSAMQHAGRFVKDKNEAAILNSKEVEGLGTGRTRPAIIENIKNKGYFSVIRKQIYPTQKCMDLFEVLPNTTLSSPSLTAQFETMIQDVEDGRMQKEDYINVINEDVREIIEKIKNDSSGKLIGSGNSDLQAKCQNDNRNKIGTCPLCGGDIIENSKSYSCSNWRSGCQFTIWKECRGKKLTDSQVKSLLNKKRTSKIKGFVSKSGLKYDGYLIFKKMPNGEYDYSHIDFSFAPEETGKKIANCPKCGGDILETDDKYYCSQCKVKIYKNGLERLGKRKISKKEALELLKGEEVKVQLVSKENKDYTAFAVYDFEKGWVKILFNQNGRYNT